MRHFGQLDCYAIRVAFVPVQVVSFCMDFMLDECLHNKNLPLWYISCEVNESLKLNCLVVVSKRAGFRTIRNQSLTLTLSRWIELSLNRGDCQALRFCLQRVLAHFLRITNIENKTILLTDVKKDSEVAAGNWLSEFGESELSRLNGSIDTSVITSVKDCVILEAC